MRKTLIIARREYRAAVRTKGFIISLILLPIFMGGSFAVFALLKDKVDLTDKKIVVLDSSGLFGDYLKQSAEYRNSHDILDPETGEKIGPVYEIEVADPDLEHPHEQKLALSDQIRRKKIHAFIEIGKNVIHPVADDEHSQIFYFAENAALDEAKGWFQGMINSRIRAIRVSELGIGADQVKDLFQWVNIKGMGLLKIDTKTGKVLDAQQSSELQTIIVPYILILLMFMMMMMSAIPLLTAVMEEKSERIAEVLLGSVTPNQFMFGKILGSLGVSLTTALIYVVAGVFTVRKLDFGEMIPYGVLPWFFVYMLLNIIMVGSIMAALGATCNDSKDAQAIQFPAMLPILVPLFLMMPIIMNPLTKFAVITSLIPIWTPMLMLLRQSTTVTIPLWQPIVGLIGVVLFTIVSVWAGGRIFRSAIIMQGKKLKLSTLIKYIIKG